jgi:hypothetical protein
VTATADLAIVSLPPADLPEDVTLFVEVTNAATGRVAATLRPERRDVGRWRASFTGDARAYRARLLVTPFMAPPTSERTVPFVLDRDHVVTLALRSA